MHKCLQALYFLMKAISPSCNVVHVTGNKETQFLQGTHNFHGFRGQEDFRVLLTWLLKWTF